jgi:hypothetical protein
MTSTASFTGSLNTSYETEPQDEGFTNVAPQQPARAGSSGIVAPIIIGGVLAAVAIAAIIANQNDDDAPVIPD